MPSAEASGQRWVVEGVSESSLRGPKRIRVFLESFGVDYHVRALTGEQRHRLIDRYRRREDLEDIKRLALLWCVRDPIDPREPAFPTDGALDQLALLAVDDLIRVVLWVSGLLPSPNAPMPEPARESEDKHDLTFLLRAVHLSASDPDEMRRRRDIAAHFIWRHEANWRSAKMSPYGVIGKSISNQLPPAARGVLEGDKLPKNENDLVFLGAVNDKRIEYLASRADLPAKGAMKPDSADYAGASESRHGFAEWELDYSGGLQAIDAPAAAVEIDTDLLASEAIEPSPYGHNYFDCWVLNGAASLRNDFASWVDIEIDVKSAIEAVCGTRTRKLTARDVEVFMWRYIAGKPRNAIAALSGLPERAVDASWRSIEPDRNGSRILAWLRDHGYDQRLDTETWEDRRRRKLVSSPPSAGAQTAPLVSAQRWWTSAPDLGPRVAWTTAPDQNLGPRVARIDYRPFGNPRLPAQDFRIILDSTGWSRA